jgi:hypothetical protein
MNASDSARHHTFQTLHIKKGESLCLEQRPARKQPPVGYVVEALLGSYREALGTGVAGVNTGHDGRSSRENLH